MGLALFSATLLALTLVMPESMSLERRKMLAILGAKVDLTPAERGMADWLEVLFGLAPDAGDGSVEWGMAITLAIATLVLFGWAGRTWRRHKRGPLRV